MVRRRTIVSAIATTPVWALIAATDAKAQDLPSLALTPQCADDDDLTQETGAGPYFKPASPNRSDLTADLNGGQLLLLTGLVLDQNCRPVANAVVDLWQADHNAEYDTVGNRCRGHQLTNAQGRWQFRTVIPGIYPGRTRHIHFRVQRPGGDLLTTQVYFPGEPQNQQDWLYTDSLLLRSGTEENAMQFDFVVA